MNKILLGLVAVILLVGGGFFLKGKVQGDSTRGIVMDELSSHSTREDCWLSIEGKVYDVTKFIPMHPGRDNILKGCGKDATELFATHGKEGGKPHSQRARDLLMKMVQVGVLE